MESLGNRYVLIDRDTRRIVDDCHGHGYKSPDGAHRSWAHKQKFRGHRRATVVPVASAVQATSTSPAQKPTTAQVAATPPPVRRRRAFQWPSQENMTPPPDIFS